LAQRAEIGAPKLLSELSSLTKDTHPSPTIFDGLKILSPQGSLAELLATQYTWLPQRFTISPLVSQVLHHFRYNLRCSKGSLLLRVVARCGQFAGAGENGFEHRGGELAGGGVLVGGVVGG
jgi:hypothetical protein